MPFEGHLGELGACLGIYSVSPHPLTPAPQPRPLLVKASLCWKWPWQLQILAAEFQLLLHCRVDGLVR